MVGTILRDARRALGYSQKELAALSGVSVRHISSIESGGNASIEIIYALATTMHVRELEMSGLRLVISETSGVIPFPFFEQTLLSFERQSAALAARVAQSRRALSALQAGTRVNGELPADVMHIELPLPPLLTWSVRAGVVRESREEWTGVPLAGEVTFGEPLYPPPDDTHVLIPARSIDPGELLYRVAGPTLGEWNIEDGDLLVVEPRPTGQAANGEFVLARVGDRIVVGRWWTKGGTRQVLSVRTLHGVDEQEPVVLGAITAILRNYQE
jgi:transcriptional regulator with XRE-family HTH domain